MRAIHAVAEGGLYLDPAIAGKVVGAAARGTPHGVLGTPAELSERETEVLRLLAEGHTSKEISSRLSISVKTVETYKARAMDKLGFKSRVDVVRYAASRGWLRDRPTLKPLPRQRERSRACPAGEGDRVESATASRVRVVRVGTQRRRDHPHPLASRLCVRVCRASPTTPDTSFRLLHRTGMTAPSPPARARDWRCRECVDAPWDPSSPLGTPGATAGGAFARARARVGVLELRELRYFAAAARTGNLGAPRRS